MIPITKEQRESLILNFGRETANHVIELLGKVVTNTGHEANTFIDKIVFELSKTLPHIQYRFQKLAVKSKDPIERLNLLMYIIKSTKLMGSKKVEE